MLKVICLLVWVVGLGFTWCHHAYVMSSQPLQASKSCCAGPCIHMHCPIIHVRRSWPTMQRSSSLAVSARAYSAFPCCSEAVPAPILHAPPRNAHPHPACTPHFPQPHTPGAVRERSNCNVIHTVPQRGGAAVHRVFTRKQVCHGGAGQHLCSIWR